MKLKISVFLVLLFTCQVIASGARSVSGVVTAGGEGLEGASVGLFEAGVSAAKLVSADETDRRGSFRIQFQPTAGALYYLLAIKDELTFAATLGPVDSSQRVVINELTTVASVFALSQFIVGKEIYGPSPGLDNAMATTANLVNQNGKPGSVISNSLNGAASPTSTLALQTQNSLANMLAACSAASEICDAFFDLTTVDGQTPVDTLQAMHNIARNPVIGLDNELLFDLAAIEELYEPGLDTVPSAWMLALHFTKGGFSAPGRHAFDSQGNLWSNNNFSLPAGAFPSTPGKQISILDPSGKPILGSPKFSRFVSGSGYGTAIAPMGDESVWISNFDDGGITQFSTRAKVINHSNGLDFPMGMAFDQWGNLWIANMGFPGIIIDDQGMPTIDPGFVAVLLGGDPENRRELHDVDAVHKPFSVAIDDRGRAWLANGAEAAGTVSILELNQDDEIVVVHDGITSDAMQAEHDELQPFGLTVGARTIAIDSNGNGWVNNFYTNRVTFIDAVTFKPTDHRIAEGSHGWGIAVDGNDLVWAQSFSNPPLGPSFHAPPDISVVQGAGQGKGFLYSFSNPSLQHVTALQIDSSGNVWTANNWSLETTVEMVDGNFVPMVVGGDGMVQFIGLATPVLTPLIGEPINPANLILP